MHVLIYGPTGTAGATVLNHCLAHPDIQRVTVLHRRSTGIEHPKLQERIHADFMDYTGFETLFETVDVCFFCLGISQMKEPNRELFFKITHDYPVAAAKALLASNPEVRFCFLSGAGADPSGKSVVAFAAAKGLAEQSLVATGLKHLFIFRPGYIHTDTPHNTRIFGERFSGFLYPVLKHITPGFVIHADELARAMLRVAINGSPDQVFENRKIKETVMQSVVAD